MALNIWALAIVKAAGTEIAAAQLVFLRAATGLAMMLPWIWIARRRFAEARLPGLHLLRIALSMVALASSYHAVTRVPLALFTAVNFTRPVVMIALAALFLGEPATPRRWLAAGLGFAGVFVAVRPGEAAPDPALLVLALAVLAGTGAVVVTRRLARQPTVVLMTGYTAGLSLAAAPLAAAGWTPVPAGAWPALLAVGLFAQGAQFCFLEAHRRAEAGTLAILGYASLILSTAVGWAVFHETPPPAFWAGAALIVLASWLARRSGPRGDDEGG